MELSSSPVLKTSLQHLREAFTADCQQKYKEAVLKYMEGAPLLPQLMKEEGVSSSTKQLLKTKCQHYLNRIQVIKTNLDAGEEIPPNPAAETARPNMDEVGEDSQDLVRTLSYIPFKCNLEDVKGMGVVKEFLWRNVVLPLMFPGLPGSVTRIKRGILLYGLPGTGKTMLMCAVASAVACPVFRVTASDLISRFVNPEVCVKPVRDVFTFVRRHQPCVLFVDDLDVLCLPERDKEDSIDRKVRDELMSQLKDMSAENQVTVIAATQKPWYLTGGLRRRFDRRFHVPLPAKEERTQIISRHFAKVKHRLSDEDFDLMGEVTIDYTGADLTVLVRSCEMVGIRTLQRATHFHKVKTRPWKGESGAEREVMMPCKSHEPGAIGITYDFLNPERIEIPPVTMVTVEAELSDVSSSVSDADLQQMNQWHEEFGQED